MKKERIINKLHNILLKKATGFYYQEECLEYSCEPPKKTNKVSEISAGQLGMFDDDFVTEKNFNNDESCKNSGKKIFSKSCDLCATKTLDLKNSGVKCKQNKKNLQGDYEVQRSLQANNEDKQALTLSKKKITTHFIPPDLLAVKMLLEINSKVNEVGLEGMSDKELLDMAKKLKNELGI